jgi:hypothetical protein
LTVLTYDRHPHDLLEGQGDHFGVDVAFEVDLGANALSDEGVLIDRRDSERPLVGALGEELCTVGEDAQRKGGCKRSPRKTRPRH